MAPSGSRSVKRGCQRVLYWIPVVFIVLIVAWSYYAYVLELCIESIDDIGEKIIYLLAYHVTFIMFVWAYWQTIFTSPMNPLKEFHLSYSDKELLERADRGESQQEILRRLAKDLPIYTRTNSGGIGGALGDPLSCCGQIRPTAFKETKQCWLRTFTYKLVVGEQTGPQSASLLPMVACWVLSVVVWRGIYRRLFTAIRFCDRCQLLKPDRCHHCSVCDKCILKMDHHCPWVNNCVGFSNYKYFMLFLAYSLLYCLFITATDLQYFIRFWTAEGRAHDRLKEYLNGLPDTQGKFHIMFLFFASSMFSVSLASLFAYHCWLVCKNRSTLEAVRGPAFRHGTDKNGFGLGFSKNFRQVFGDERRYWLLPVFSSLGDGCSFPTCLVNQDAEQPCSPEGHNANKIATEIQFPAKPLRESQSRLLTSTPSWIESDSAEDRERNGTSNPIMIIEHEA